MNSVPAENPEWDERLTKAFALKLATSDFSQAAAVEAAASALEAVVSNAANIELVEGKRQMKKSFTRGEYQQLGKYADARYGRNCYEIEAMLESADSWPFRVLQAAKRIRKKQLSPDRPKSGPFLKDR